MEIAAGALLALAVGGLATLAGFDRERSFYPVILMVIGSYYGLFALMSGATSALWAEALALAVFTGVAVVGFRTSLWIVAAALVAHGLLDMVHHRFVDNPGVPAWWPEVCLGFDVVAAGYLAMRLLQKRRSEEPLPLR